MMSGKHTQICIQMRFVNVQESIKAWEHRGAEVMRLNCFHDFHSGKSF